MCIKIKQNYHQSKGGHFFKFSINLLTKKSLENERKMNFNKKIALFYNYKHIIFAHILIFLTHILLCTYSA